MNNNTDYYDEDIVENVYEMDEDIDNEVDNEVDNEEIYEEESEDNETDESLLRRRMKEMDKMEKASSNLDRSRDRSLRAGKVEADTMIGTHMYIIFHVICMIYGIYLTINCNGGLKLSSVVLIILFPWFYIILQFMIRGFC